MGQIIRHHLVRKWGAWDSSSLSWCVFHALTWCPPHPTPPKSLQQGGISWCTCFFPVGGLFCGKRPWSQGCREEEAHREAGAQ